MSEQTKNEKTSCCCPLAVAPAASPTPDGAAPTAPVPSVPQVPSVPSDTAKLRDALVQVQRKINYLIGNLTVPNSLVANRMEINGIINAALASPPRNCDVYTPEVLLNEFLDEMPEEVKNGTTEHERKLIEITAKGVIDALFAPYNPEKESETSK